MLTLIVLAGFGLSKGSVGPSVELIDDKARITVLVEWFVEQLRQLIIFLSISFFQHARGLKPPVGYWLASSVRIHLRNIFSCLNYDMVAASPL